MSGRDRIPGGETEAVAQAGGEALWLQLATLLSGHRLDHVVYALTTQLGGTALLLGDTAAEAKTMLDVMAADAKNIVDLNWHRHAEAVAAAHAAAPAQRWRQ